MPRERRGYDRETGVRDALLIVIASEGAGTEPEYFAHVRESLHNPRMKIHVLRRDAAGESSPASVMASLVSFDREHRLRSGDQLWLVIDRDPQSWKPGTLARVARDCHTRGYHLAVSNPFFELWLLLHFADIPALSEANRQAYLDDEARIRRELTAAVARHHGSDYGSCCYPLTNTAIARGRLLDTNPRTRWPNALGTRVYLLLETIVAGEYTLPPAQ